MSINAIENSGNPNAPQASNAPSQDALRRAAQQFEAILLMQLTSALSGSGDDENALFGGDGGTDLAKKMFSEQLATTMAESGGIGLSDIILRQFGVTQAKNSAPDKFPNAMLAIREITSGNVSENVKTAPLINKNGKIEPVKYAFTGDPNDAEVVSRFEDQYKSYAPQNATVNVSNQTGSQFMPNLDAPVNLTSPNAPKNSEGFGFQMPVNGRISSNFGNRFHPVDKKVKFHAGIDIAAPTGTPIGASAEGIVTFAGWRKGYGNLVIIEHPDGRETRYGHAEKLFVKTGETVSAGQQIAAVGSTGKSTGPHLHFEVRENGQPVDPKNFLSNVLKK